MSSSEPPMGDSRPAEDDEPLERHPHAGEMPSDVDVQAERQEEGVEAEIEEELVEEHRRRLAEHEREEGG